MNNTEKDLHELGKQVVPNENKAFEVLSKFSEKIVTQSEVNRLPNTQSWFTTTANFIYHYIMDAKGIVTSLQVLAVIAVIGVIATILSLTGQKPEAVPQTNQTAQITVTPTDAVIVADASGVEEMSKQIDTAVAELDALQKELDELEASLSTADIDSTLSTIK